jgi:predicted RNA-binding protein with TRAM domain
MTNPAAKIPDSTLRTLALILLPLLGIALVIAIALLVRKPKDNASVAVVVTEGQAGAAINTGDIIDATSPGAGIAPRLGYRYKVFVDDESDDRSSGIAKIGGLVTFIPEARRGQTAIVDVTRVRDRVADAVLVKVLSQVDLPPKAPRTPFVPLAGDSAAHVVNGAEMDVIISEASAKNPGTEGVAKVSGLVIFVNGVTTIGQRVNVRITERRERVAFAEPTGKPAGTDPLPASAEPVRRVFQPRPGDPVVPGVEMDVIITEASSKNPATEGVAKVGGLVVFVNGATTIGQRVNVRITDRRERVAFAELTGKPAGTGPVASSGTTGEIIRRAFSPSTSDPAGNVIAGAEMDVVIAELSSKNPTAEGVAKVNGLVVFVEGATTIGERVNIRITARRERMAFAELTGKPAGTDPLPVQAAPAVPSRSPRAPFIPGPGDSAAQVVPGAVIATTITEASSKNPTTEGVARVNGLVVFVRGATTIGQAVNVRITDRRERVAMGEVTTDAPTPMPAVAAPAPTAPATPVP